MIPDRMIPTLLNIRAMTREDLNLAIDWAAQEGWNPGLYDAEPFWAADPGGFLIGEIASDHGKPQPVSVISAVRYGEDFGFIGFYIVKPEYRGQGYGWAIWQAAMQHLQGRTLGLDGVVAQQDNYRRSGFVLAQRNRRYAGQGPAVPVETVGQAAGAFSLMPLNSIPWIELMNYDRRCFPAAREAFLRAWIAQPGTRSLAAVTGGRLCGYGVIRPCRSGFKIGPLFADGPEIAESLFTGLSQEVPPEVPYFLDVMESAPQALDLVARHGMQLVFETARMYLSPPPNLALGQIYGISSFELG
jgi:ribosomal protein S18 acetylase RimI-like enzyme